MRLAHIAWNLGGLSIPLVVAVFTVPSLIERLGGEKFGLLALAWGLIGYAGALDLGLGRALTQMVAAMRGENNTTSIPDTLLTAGRITLLVGLFAGILIAVFAALGGAKIIRADSTEIVEIQFAIYLLAIALPAQAISATYKGLNEAFMNFKGINILRACLGVVTFAGPYVVSLFTVQLPWLVMTLVASRLISLFIFKKLAETCLQRESLTQYQPKFSIAIAKKLFGFGGWVTVSSVISPLMAQSDRFFIAAMISASAVSVYVLPYEVVVQSLILVGAISSVMFPGLSQLIKEKPNDWHPYFHEWLLRVTILMSLVCVSMAILLPWLLPLWIGKDLDILSILIGQILCIGVLANSVGSMFYSVLHAKGRSDLTAKIHIFELPIFLFALIALIDLYGMIGAAIAWSGRMVLDAIFMYLMQKWTIKTSI